jgi:hypothetical protein
VATRPGAQPPTLSTYAIFTGVLVTAIAGLGLISVRLMARRAGARLAPTTRCLVGLPDLSIRERLAASRCYNCATARPDAAWPP